TPVDVVVVDAPRNPISEALALKRWVTKALGTGEYAEPILVFDLKGAFYAGFIDAPYVLHITDPPSLLAADISKLAPSQQDGWKRALRRPQMIPAYLRAEGTHFLNARGA